MTDIDELVALLVERDTAGRAMAAIERVLRGPKLSPEDLAEIKKAMKSAWLAESVARQRLGELGWRLASLTVAL